MNKQATASQQRGALIGLALLLVVFSANAATSSQELRRQLRAYSYILIVENGEQRVIFLGKGPDRVTTDLTLRPSSAVSDRIDLLHKLADEDSNDAISQLTAALSDPSPQVRLAAIRLLGERDSAEARMALETVLYQPDESLRREVVDAVADNDGAERLLVIAREDSAESVAEAARQYLEERYARH